MEPQHDSAKLEVRRWNTLGVTVGAGVLAMVLVAGALVWFSVARMADREFVEQRMREARTISAIISRDLSEHMLAGGGREVWAQVGAEAQQYVQLTEALRVFVLTAGGEIKSASDAAAVGTRMEVKRNPECPGCDWSEAFPAHATLTAPSGETRLRVVNTIPQSQACVGCHTKLESARGFVVIDFDLSPLERAGDKRTLVILGLGAVSSVVLLVLVALLLKYLVIRPVNLLKGAMDRLAAGNSAERASVPAQNEIGALGGHFNRMAERLETAQTESMLLYKLVVESSKKLELADFVKNVSRVIQESLSPRHSAFVLETPSGGFICVTTSEAGEQTMTAGDESLDAALHSNCAIEELADLATPQLIEEAHRSLELRTVLESGEPSFALPVVFEGRLLGMLYCDRVPARFPISKDLLNNLGVHLMLAANNSRHYTGAVTDGLTNLANKQYGLVRLEEAVFAAKRYRARLGLIMCDIDYFKRINDSHGHPAGDVVLKEVARRIKASVRKSDIVVRYGGEEFMLIIPEVSTDLLATIGEKIRAAVAAAPIGLGVGLSPTEVTVSVGVAEHNVQTDSGQALIARADAALYQAKRNGRNRVEVSH